MYFNFIKLHFTLIKRTLMVTNLQIYIHITAMMKNAPQIAKPNTSTSARQVNIANLNYCFTHHTSICNKYT